MNWSGFALHGPARWIGGGGVLLGLVGIVLSQTLLSPDYEVLYSGGVSVAHCTNIEERRVCNFSYGLSVGNTGKLAQESLSIEWPLNLRHWGVQAQVADIVASAKATPLPQIRPVFESDRTVYTINGLMPNTMVRLYTSCLSCTPEQLQAMRQARPIIVARGTVSEGSPRMSALQRLAMNALRVVGLFF